MGDPAPRRIRKGSRASSDEINRNDGRYHFVTDTAGGKSNLLNTSNTGSYHWFEALKVVQQEHVRDGSFPLHMRSEEHMSELQSPDNISYAVFCLKKKFF